VAAVRILTDRLCLRPFAPSDADRLHVVLNLPGVRRYLLDDTVMPRSWVEDVIASSQASFAAHGFGLWCIALGAGDGEAIGFTGYREFREPPVVELIYGLEPEHQGEGLAYEASRAAARYGFEALGWDPIHLSLDAPNEASLRLALRLGAHETGRGPGPAWEQIHLELRRASFEIDAGRCDRFDVRPEPGA
jgi:ribosomal-protein-alanine N-acetyltransferase